MKQSSAPDGRKPINRAKARNCAVLNLLATPGLGSLVAGRFAAGIGQLALAVTGFVLFLVWFIRIISQYYGQIDGTVAVKPVGPIGVVGVVLFVAAWFWSLATSLSVNRESREYEIEELKRKIGAPPVMNKLNPPQINTVLANVPEWTQHGSTITRTFQFKDFPAAIQFVNALAFVAEKANHHPDIDIRWNKVTLTLTTHDAGGLTEKDFAMAKAINAL